MTDTELEQIARALANRLFSIPPLAGDWGKAADPLILTALKSVRDQAGSPGALCAEGEIYRNEAGGLRDHASYWHDADCTLECPNWRDHEISHLERENTDLRAHFSIIKAGQQPLEQRIEVLEGALETIIRRVALVSPYYEIARAALSPTTKEEPENAA